MYKKYIIHHAHPPIVGDNAEILILGTFPSPLSREKGEYYGNPRNQFWRLIFGVYGHPFEQPDYENKKSILFNNRIALWDVVTACEIDGALDANIKNPTYNTELPLFIVKHKIKGLFFNGNNAYLSYKRNIGSVERKVLPSSSPANAGMGFEDKLIIWKEQLGVNPRDKERM